VGAVGLPAGGCRCFSGFSCCCFCCCCCSCWCCPRGGAASPAQSWPAAGPRGAPNKINGTFLRPPNFSSTRPLVQPSTGGSLFALCSSLFSPQFSSRLGRPTARRPLGGQQTAALRPANCSTQASTRGKHRPAAQEDAPPAQQWESPERHFSLGPGPGSWAGPQSVH